MSLHLGQRIQIDLFGMRVAGLGGDDFPVEGTVVGLAPGAVTVQLSREDGGLSEVTISPGRIERAA
jgi:hypothetical protein